MMKGYADLYELTEDERIEAIGKTVMAGPSSSTDKPLVVAVIVDDDGKKAKRYCKKLKAKYPGIRILKKFKGPVPGTVTIQVGPPLR